MTVKLAGLKKVGAAVEARSASTTLHVLEGASCSGDASGWSSDGANDRNT
jgi:hypothetical protein